MKEKFLNYLAVIIMAVITLTALILWLSGTVDIDSVIDFIDENRKIAVFGILALFLLKGFCPLIPYAAIVIASSAIFSLPFAALLSLAGTVICVSISYFAGRRTKSVSLETYLEKKPKLKKYFDGRSDTGFLFCFITHAVGLSLEAQGIIYGLMRLPYAKYLLGTMLALLPSMFTYLVLGTAELGVSSPWFYALAAYDVVVIVICSIYLKRHVLTKGGKENGAEKQ